MQHHMRPRPLNFENRAELFSEIWAVSYKSERRWDVHLKTG